jgi:hypothetical protein
VQESVGQRHRWNLRAVERTRVGRPQGPVHPPRCAAPTFDRVSPVSHEPLAALAGAAGVLLVVEDPESVVDVPEPLDGVEAPEDPLPDEAAVAFEDRESVR